jgi:hypothetical protein
MTLAQAQDSTRAVLSSTVSDTSRYAPNAAADLLNSLTDSTVAVPLLPDHMLITQQLLWGKKGLVRLITVAPLTIEGRSQELKVRRTMLKLHQVSGFVTLVGFVAQGIIGSQLYNAKGADYSRLRSLHEGMATAVNVAYATTALLSFTSPPPAVGLRRGLNSVKLHKYLAIVHLAGMIVTNILAKKISDDATLRPYHRAVAYTTFGAFATAIVVLKF